MGQIGIFMADDTARLRSRHVAGDHLFVMVYMGGHLSAGRGASLWTSRSAPTLEILRYIASCENDPSPLQEPRDAGHCRYCDVRRSSSSQWTRHVGRAPFVLESVTKSRKRKIIPRIACFFSFSHPHNHPRRRFPRELLSARVSGMRGWRTELAATHLMAGMACRPYASC